MQGFEHIPIASEPCCSAHWPWEPLKFLTIIIKIYETTKIRTRTYCLENFCPNLIASIYFLIKRVGKNTLKKKKNDPTY